MRTSPADRLLHEEFKDLVVFAFLCLAMDLALFKIVISVYFKIQNSQLFSYIWTVGWIFRFSLHIDIIYKSNFYKVIDRLEINMMKKVRVVSEWSD
jgi:hypothetical protein